MILQFTNVKKYYGAFLALDIPSLSINSGIWWVKGENGSGKTTLLKMIAGIHPFEGAIQLDEWTLAKNRQLYLQQFNYKRIPHLNLKIALCFLSLNPERMK